MSSVTLDQIAKRARLSVPTISRALTNDPTISESTRRRVWELSRHMGYQRRLRQRWRDRHGFARVGFVMISTPEAALTEDISSGSLALAGKAHRLRVDLHHVDPGDDNALVTALSEVSGQCEAILIYGRITAAALGQLGQRGARIVMLGNPEGGIRVQPPAVVVTSDMIEMGRVATQRLIEAGHRRIGFATGLLEPGMWADSWHTGYQLAHVQAGVAVDRELMMNGDDPLPGQSGRSFAQWFTSMKSDPATAFVFHDNSIAYDTLNELRRLGVDVPPADVSIGGRRARARWPLPYPTVLEDADVMIESAMAQLRLLISSGGALHPTTVLVPFHTDNFNSNDLISST